ncbi:MAG: VOC family protein [Betaproteobacteria bacterium]|nr:VOC family protein [Betaproteobacteria bacterium]
MSASVQVAASQPPTAGKLNLDHIAHFVPHIDDASAALEQAGFTLTPFSAQSHRLEPGGPLVPAGSGNRCVMLREGYLEFLTPTADTPIARQLREAIARYTGVHLIAFGSADAPADHARLDKAGFNPLPTVALQRQIGTEQGEETARFSVVRVPPGTMAEGRIQYCQQHTPQWLWQERWIHHANGARGLVAVIVCVADPREAAQRYSRFTGLLARVGADCWRIDSQRGALLFVTPERLHRTLGVAAPALPWIAGYVLSCDSLNATRARLAAGDCAIREAGAQRLLLQWPPALGGFVLFQPAGSAPPDFS